MGDVSHFSKGSLSRISAESVFYMLIGWRNSVNLCLLLSRQLLSFLSSTFVSTWVFLFLMGSFLLNSGGRYVLATLDSLLPALIIFSSSLLFLGLFLARLSQVLLKSTSSSLQISLSSLAYFIGLIVQISDYNDCFNDQIILLTICTTLLYFIAKRQIFIIKKWSIKKDSNGLNYIIKKCSLNLYKIIVIESKILSREYQSINVALR